MFSTEVVEMFFHLFEIVLGLMKICQARLLNYEKNIFSVEFEIMKS